MSSLFRRIWWVLNRRKHERELLDEMKAHREMMGEESANFGSSLRLMEETREDWGFVWFDRLWQDLSYAGRQLRRSPAFALSAVGILAVGIGLNIAAFSLVNFIAFRPFAVRDPDSIVRFSLTNQATYLPNELYLFLREHGTAFQTIFSHDRRSVITNRETRRTSTVAFVSGNYFTELAGVPALGRFLDGADNQPGAQPVVVISWREWTRRFGSDKAAVGRTIPMGDKMATVVGVAPAGFTGLSTEVELWTQAEGASLSVYGRLKSGVSAPAAEESLHVLMQEFARIHPDLVGKNNHLKLKPGGYPWDERRGIATGFYILGALAFLILTVACLNLGNLLLARSLSRERELAIRISIGAGRLRLLRQLLTECLLLASLGAVAGLALSVAVTRVLAALTSDGEQIKFSIDHRVLGFTVLITVIAVVLFGLLPSLRVSRQNYGTGRLRAVMVAVQVAASCVLLLFSAAAINANRFRPPAIAYQELLFIEPRLDSQNYTDAAAKDYLEALQARLRQVPGVVSTSATGSAPLALRSVMSLGAIRAVAEIYRVGPGYLRTVGVRILQGRDFSEAQESSVILIQPLANRLWPDQNPIGKLFGMDKQPVIGIAEGRNDDLAIYYPLTNGYSRASVVVRTAMPPESLVDTSLAIARNLDPKLTPLVATTESFYWARVRESIRAAAAISLPGAIGLLLAVSGLYGLLLYTVSQRTKEIGIRVALGASRTNIAGMVLKQFALPIGLGLAVGIIAGIALITGLLSRQNLRIDAVTCLCVAMVFLTTCALAGAGPVLRALRLNPNEALRHE